MKHRVSAMAVGAYEEAVGNHIVPLGNCWLYSGREDITHVRRFVIGTFDPDYPDIGGIIFTTTCGRARCVRPPHLREKP